MPHSSFLASIAISKSQCLFVCFLACSRFSLLPVCHRWQVLLSHSSSVYLIKSSIYPVHKLLQPLATQKDLSRIFAPYPFQVSSSPVLQSSISSSMGGYKPSPTPACPSSLSGSTVPFSPISPLPIIRTKFRSTRKRSACAQDWRDDNSDGASPEDPLPINDPMPWLWTCHKCSSCWPLGVTRRCLHE